MKILVTTSGDKLEANMDSRFGRAPRFLVYDTEQKGFEIIDNQQNLAAAQGAGIQAAQNVAQLQADCVITGHCGPKAYQVLQEAGIKVFHTTAQLVSEAIQQFESGQLTEALKADKEGHWV